jgi:hypothetical protein
MPVNLADVGRSPYRHHLGCNPAFSLLGVLLRHLDITSGGRYTAPPVSLRYDGIGLVLAASILGLGTVNGWLPPWSTVWITEIVANFISGLIIL